MNTTANGEILKFMNVEPVLNSFTKKWSYNDGVFFSTSNEDKEKVFIDMCNYAKYSTDWTWLIQVVEKIKFFCSNEDFLNSLKTEQIRDCLRLEIYIENEFRKSTLEKEKVYNACIKFISWFNENKK